MEAAIYAWTNERIEGILALCGIDKSCNKRIDPLVAELSSVGEYIGHSIVTPAWLTLLLVHESLLEAGFNETDESTRLINNAFQELPPSSQGFRGSYRLLKGGKRSVPDLKGLCAPTERKRRKNATSKATKRYCEKQTPKDGAIEEERESGPINSFSAPADDINVEVRQSDTVRGALDNLHSMEQNTEISSKIEGTYGSSSHRSLAKNLPPWLESGYASKVVTTVIVNCVRLNSAIGLEGQKVVKVSLTADPSQIEQYAESISKLEYNKAVNVVKRDNAVATGRNLQRRLNETVYWDIILKGAKLIDTATLPRAKGPDDGFEPAEKAAAKRLMEDLGYGLSPESQRQHRTLWKALFDMRKAGISKFLIYRTQEFDTYCKSYPRRCAVTLVNRVTEWERVYRSYIEHLENLVTRFIEGDVARRAYLTYAAVAARINIPGLSWNDASNAWFSPDEEYSFTVKDGAVAVLPDNLGVAFGGRSLLADEKDKAIFMLLSPRDDKFLSVRPLIPVDAGDFLGIFPGKIRYSREFTPKWGIPGPDEGLWLDYSQTTGTLTQMRVAQPGDYANVRLHWELFSETDTSRPRWLWRVSVRALEAIAPLEELVREAYHEEQYLLHQSVNYAQQGYLSGTGGHWDYFFGDNI